LPTTPDNDHVPFTLTGFQVFEQFHQSPEASTAAVYYKILADPVNNRMKSEVKKEIFAWNNNVNKDTLVLDLERQRLLVGNEAKGMCISYQLKDLSSI
jgi:hypothetical protein